jgi:site-specific recombinase XerD
MPALLVEFRDWLVRHRGLKEPTIVRYEWLMLKLLPALGEDPTSYDAALVRQVLLDAVRGLGIVYAKTFVCALRAFLRFLASEGRCRPDLHRAVPTIAHWRLSDLPRYIAAADVERVIASCDATKAHGVRDRAILLLLARLGLRAGDIVAMRLCDLDWDEGTVRVRGKGRKDVRLPLPQDAGDALLEYLVHARPAADTDRVFLCAQAPIRPFASTCVVSDVVRLALRRAGITDPPSKGAHLLRHSAATTMLREGVSLDVIASVLRHGSTETTAYYAKVDVNLLQQVAQPWPEVPTC